MVGLRKEIAREACRWFWTANSAAPSHSRARAQSYLDAYFVFPNGSALTLSELSV